MSHLNILILLIMLKSLELILTFESFQSLEDLFCLNLGDILWNVLEEGGKWEAEGKGLGVPLHVHGLHREVPSNREQVLALLP